MDESRRLAMRRAHAKRVHYCSCGRMVVGNGGKASHAAMHKRQDDGHRYLTYDAYRRAQQEADIQKDRADV